MKLGTRRFSAFFHVFCLNGIIATLFWGTAFSKTIISFGDSITQGCSIESGICGFVGGYGYPTELQVLLAENGWEIPVYNYGKAGETTDEGVNRIDTVLDDACNQDAGYLLLLEGTNDLGYFSSFSTIYFNLGVMIDKARARGIEPLLATITPDPRDEYEYKQIPEMNEYIRRLAVEKDVVLVDLYNELAPDWIWYVIPSGCYGDILHPNFFGFQAIAYEWYVNLDKIFPKPLPKTFPWLPLLLGS